MDAEIRRLVTRVKATGNSFELALELIRSMAFLNHCQSEEIRSVAVDATDRLYLGRYVWAQSPVHKKPSVGKLHLWKSLHDGLYETACGLVNMATVEWLSENRCGLEEHGWSTCMACKHRCWAPNALMVRDLP